MYLQKRNRILKSNHLQSEVLVAETILTPNDFIVPLFIDEGENVSYRNSFYAELLSKKSWI